MFRQKEDQENDARNKIKTSCSTFFGLRFLFVSYSCLHFQVTFSTTFCSAFCPVCRVKEKVQSFGFNCLSHKSNVRESRDIGDDKIKKD